MSQRSLPRSGLWIATLAWVLLSAPAAAFTPSGLLEIHTINVQQGTSTLLIGPDGTTVLMDGGRSGRGAAEVVPYLESLGLVPADGLDHTLVSHIDQDHVGGLDEVLLAGYDVRDGNWYNGSTKPSTTFEDYRLAAAVTTAGMPAPIPLGERIALGDGAFLEVVAVHGEVLGHGAVPGAAANENDLSIAVFVQYGEFDYLWAGDLGGGDDDRDCTGRRTDQANVETPLAEALAASGALGRLGPGGLDVLHVSHHGSESSTNSEWMSLLRPEVALISVGDGQGGNFQHPRRDVVEEVLLAGAPCVTALPVQLILQTEEGDPSGPETSFAGHAVGDVVVTTAGEGSYRVEATGAVSQGPDERAAAALPRVFPLPEAAGGCVAGPTALCLNEERFRVTARWATPDGSSGAGRAERLTADTGYFWFFERDNVEVVVKVIEGCPVNDHFWVFAAGLTNVEVELTVEDTDHPGTATTYTNPQRRPFETILDNQAFATCEGPTNLAPTASFTWDCRGFACAFGDLSSDPDGELVSRRWDLGDGTMLEWQFVTDFDHLYPAAGTYPVELTVEDDGGQTDTVIQDVDVLCIPSFRCCKVCSASKACGDSCISRTFNCSKPRGCACDAREVC